LNRDLCYPRVATTVATGIFQPFASIVGSNIATGLSLKSHQFD
jgi:hypothetical protein